MTIIKKSTGKRIVHTESVREQDEDTIEMFESYIEDEEAGKIVLDEDFKAYMIEEIRVLKEKWNIH